MSFLKFLSTVSLSLLFLGNVAAECVDLSGTYSGEGKIMTFSKISDEGGIFGYSIMVKRNGIEGPMFSFSGFPEEIIPTITCTKDQMETKLESPHGTMTITAILKEKILTILAATHTNDGRRTTMNEETYHKQ